MQPTSYMRFFKESQQHVSVLDLGSDTAWSVHSDDGNFSIKAKVPGGIYSDLDDSGYIEGDIYYRFNDVKYAWVGNTSWVYERTLHIPEKFFRAGNRYVLNFEGLDTVASVLFDQKHVGSSENMFRRYRYDVSHILSSSKHKDSAHTLTVAFDSPVKYAAKEAEYHKKNRYIVPPECLPEYIHGAVCHANFIRKIQASFGWDVGPAYPSSGIYQPVFLEAYDRASMQYIKFQAEFNGNDQEEAVWNFKCTALVEVATEFNANLQIEIRDNSGSLVFAKTDESVRLLQTEVGDVQELVFIGSIPASRVETWWPNGHGNQTLYSLQVAVFDAASNEEATSKEELVGFRTIEIIEEDMKTLLGVPDANGSTFFFRVNKEPLFVKGANLPPIHILPERVSREMVDTLLDFARASHMNMIRVWGGGAYQADYFYRRADELGILIWQDFMFGCSLYPATDAFLGNVRQEALHQVRRLQHHASIAMWSGNNEDEDALTGNWWGLNGLNPKKSQWPNSYASSKQYYADYAKLTQVLVDVILQETEGMPWVPSSPSNAKLDKERGYITPNTGGPFYGDGHYYNRLQNQWNSTIYPVTRMETEYGFQSFPSFSTLRKYSKEEDLYWLSRFMIHRQHGSDNANDKMVFTASFHFDVEPLEHDRSSKALRKFIYLAQLNHAESLRVETEHHRRYQSLITEDYEGLTMGALYWQLNSIWPGASLSSFEFGGRWKVANYVVEKMFRDLIVSIDERVGNVLEVYLINDQRLKESDLTLELHIQKYTELKPCHSTTFHNLTAEAKKTNLFQYMNISSLLNDCDFSDVLSDDSVTDIQSAREKSVLDLSYDMADDESLLVPRLATEAPRLMDRRRRASFIRFVLKRGSSGTVLSETVKYLSEPKNALGLINPEIKSEVVHSERSPSEALIRLRAARTAIFVYLESHVDGVFNDNAILMHSGKHEVIFTAKEPIRDWKEFEQSLVIYSYFDGLFE